MEKSTINVDIGKRIKELVDGDRLTSKHVANTINVTTSAFSKYLSGERAIPLEGLIKLSDFFGVTLEWLISGKDEKEKCKFIKVPYIECIDVDNLVDNPSKLKEANQFINIEYKSVSKIGLDKNNCIIVDIFTSALVPDLKQGDRVLFDLSVNKLSYVIDGEIYLLRINDAIKIKKVRYLKNEIIAVWDDGAPQNEMELDKAKGDNFQILGHALTATRILTRKRIPGYFKSNY